MANKRPKRFLIDITLHFAGLNLDPDSITDILDISPSRGYKLGEAYEIFDGRIMHRRNGVWAFNQMSRSGDFDGALAAFGEEIRSLLLKLKEKKLSLQDLPGVERAHLDVVIIATIDSGVPTERAFRVSPGNAKWLADLNLPIDFTIDNIIESDPESGTGSEESFPRCRGFR